MSNMYESGSLPRQFKPHQQGPKGLPTTAFGKSTNPSPMILQDRASYVYVNVNGTYAFAYESGSLLTGDGVTGRTLYTTGSLLGAAAGGPVKFDINPVAWRQTDAAGTVGDVTFVYQGGL
jgi:hypothetical protein